MVPFPDFSLRFAKSDRLLSAMRSFIVFPGTDTVKKEGMGEFRISNFRDFASPRERSPRNVHRYVRRLSDRERRWASFLDVRLGFVPDDALPLIKQRDTRRTILQNADLGTLVALRIQEQDHWPAARQGR